MSRSSLAKMLALAVACALPLTSMSASAVPVADPGKPAARKPGPLPVQRQGTPGGPAEIGKNLNHVVPPTLRSRYPLQAVDSGPVRTSSITSTTTSSVAAVKGYVAGTSRELTAKRSKFEQVFANPDGTETTVFSQVPVNYRRPDGTWAPVDTTLTRDTAKRQWVAAKSEVVTRIADRAQARPTTVTVALDDEHEIAWGLQSTKPVAATVAGDKATFPGIAQDADLLVEAKADGAKESIVLRSARAPLSYTFPLRLKGLAAKIADGGVELTDARGVIRAAIPAGFMVDAAGIRSEDVRYALVPAAAGGQALRVDIDAAWVRDAARVFPITVDPTVAAASSTTAITVSDKGVLSGSSSLQVGCRPPLPYDQDCSASGTQHNMVYLGFPNVTSALWGHRIFGAKLSMLNYDSGACASREVSVHPVREAWSASSADWPGPAVGPAISKRAFNHGFMFRGSTKSACPYKQEVFDLFDAGRQTIQNWVSGAAPNYGFSLRASSPNDKRAWKLFTGTATANPPRLYITHSPYNATYKFQGQITAVTPSVAGKYSIRVTNKSAYEWKPGQFHLGYRLFDGRTRKVLVAMTAAAQLTTAVPRGGTVTLTATVQPLAGEPKGRPYILDFTMVDTARNKAFMDEGVSPARAAITVYNTPPTSKRWWPVNGYQPTTLRPTLSVTASDLESPPSGLTYRFEVCESVPGNDRLGCFFSGTGTTGSYGAASSWTVPAAKLSWNKKYLWRVYVKDSGGAVEPTLPALALLTEVPQPVLTSRIANGAAGTGDRDFDPQVGNYTTAVVDASVPGAGPSLDVLRTYNSLDPRRTGAFGAGWSSRYDAVLKQEGVGGNVLITYPDGQQVRFGLNPNGKYAAPNGRKATLVKDATGWTLRGGGTTKYRFDTSGRLTQVTEAGGKPLTLAYGTDGRLSTVTSQQGGNRKLTFTWTTQAAGVAPHVAGVSTDPVDGAALTWTYTYNGDLLTKMCDPQNACTTYDSTPGSHYRTAVLDSRPESYWRFGDEQGDPASSEVDINLNDDGGAYQGSVTYGHAGAINGSEDKAVYLGATGFAAVDVKKSLFRRVSDASVEVWFRTNSQVTRPLLGYQNKAIGVASTAGMPILYIGNDGKLRGQFWNGAAVPITAPQAVNNDQWHHVVLSAEGTKQTLYLDGVAVGTTDGGRIINNDPFAFNQWGAAYAVAPGAWPAYGTALRTSYGGWMDEGAIYSHPLSAQDVQQHYQLGRGKADQLSKISEPSGKVQAEIGYDTGLDRVNRLVDDNGGSWQVGAPVTDGGADDLRRTVEITDPANRMWFYEYDALGGWLLREGRPNGLGVRPEDMPLPEQDGDYDLDSLEGVVIRSFTHDASGRMTKVTDERGAELRLTYDARGNVASRTQCREGVSVGCNTEYNTYQAGLTDELDPRWDLPLVSRDARSASATDNTYATTRTYTSDGSLATLTAPGGLKTTYAYTAGTETAPGGGTMPAGLLRTQTDQRGAVTTYTYDASGLLVELTSPGGARTSYAYDAVGRKTAQTVKVAGRPDATTTYTYDKGSRVTSVTAPRTTDAVTGTQRQLRADLTYDVDGNTETVTTKDALDGGVEARVVRSTYDAYNRVSEIVDADGGETSYGYDQFGNKTSTTDALGNHVEYAYTARNMLAEVRLFDPDGLGKSYDPDHPTAADYAVIESRGYDQAGRQVRQGDALGRNIRYDYNDDNTVERTYLQAFHNPDGTTRDYVLTQNTYDAAGNLTTAVTNNGRVTTTNTIDAAGRTTRSVVSPGAGPGVVSRTTDYAYDAKGDLVQLATTGTPSGATVPAQTAVTSNVYQPDTGQLIEQRVHTSAAPDPVVVQVSRWTYDQTGQALSVTTPRGNTTSTADDGYTTRYGYDEVGRQVRVEKAPVATEVNGQPAVTVRPTTVVGFNTFGEVTSAKDPLGNIIRTTYNKRGLPVETIAPAYTPPSGGSPLTPTIRTEYDAAGQIVAIIDARGNVTRYGYDRSGRRISVDAPLTTNDDRAVWSYAYLRNGLPSSVTDPNGGKLHWTYDDLDRQITSTQVERKPSPLNLTATTTWDDAGNVIATATPGGAVTTSTYDGLGQLLKVTDPNNVSSTFGYDSAGRSVLSTDGLGRASRSSYDLAGQLLSQTELDKDGNALGTARYGYDLDGNLATSTTASGHTSAYTYNALGQIIRQVEPVSATASVTTTYGYDASGSTSRATDGRGNTTLYTTNPLGLPEKVIEPATTAYPAAADRTWTASYDQEGNAVKLVAPGGVQQTRVFDAAGRLIQEDGAGAQAATSSRTLGYDVLDQVVSASAPGGTNTYTYNDRGLLLTAAGPSGEASYVYNDDGSLTSRTDAAGTADFTYTKGRLTAVKDPVTRTTQTLDYNAAGQIASIDYGAGRVRGLGYDAFGRMSTDTLKNSAGSTVSSVNYGYDVDGQVTRKTTTGLAGAGDNTYTYDQLGRLSTWTVNGQTTEYGWDNAGNRTKAGNKTASYDERNRLITDGTLTYAYSARGTLTSKSNGTTTQSFGFDAFDRLITQAGKTSQYDAFDRPTSNGSAVMKYAGFDSDPAADGTQTYGHGLDGGLLAVGQGEIKRLALADRHGDVIGGFDPADSTLSALPDSRTYNPFGEVTATGGTRYGVGYQGDWTDPASGQVNMGARWYDPASGTFDSRDSITWGPGSSSTLTNLYAYGAGNPVNNVDTDGHSPYDPEKNLGDCYYQWIPPKPGDDAYGKYKLICPPKPNPVVEPKKPTKPKKPGNGGKRPGGGKKGGGDDGRGGGGDDGHNGGGKVKPKKPVCDAECQAEKKRKADQAKTDRTKKVVQQYVRNNRVATPGVTSPHCAGANPVCPRYTGKPATTTSDSRKFDDPTSNIIRRTIVNQNGPVATPASTAGGNCLLCMGMGLGMNKPMDICAGGSCFAPDTPGTDTNDDGFDLDGGALGQALGWTILAAVGVGLEAGGAGLAVSGVTSCAGVITCPGGLVIAGGGLVVVVAGEAIRGVATTHAAEQWARVLENKSSSSGSSPGTSGSPSKGGGREPEARKGWQVGDDVDAKTTAGNEPAWNTVKARHWKNRAAEKDAKSLWSDENLERMKQGNAPQRYNPDKGGRESMELSHEPIPRRDGGKDYVERWPCEHAAVDVWRRPGYCK